MTSGTGLRYCQAMFTESRGDGRGRRRERRFGGSLLLLLVLALWAGALAQEVAEPVTAPEVDGEVVTGTLEGAPPAVFSVGLSAGFPAYQTVALAASLQAQYVGVQLKGSWTAAGPYIGGQLRAYPPIPLPVPLFVGVGGGVYGPNASFHFALGGHVPLGQNLRLDVEAGIANVPLLAERSWAPHVAVGVSYAFPVELGASTGRTTERATREAEVAPPSPACPAPTAPDPSGLGRAVSATVDSWLRSAQATYGSVYTDLSYSYRITDTQISGNSATVTVSYSGSVREILTGVRHQASGTASASFVWNGCGWSGGSVDY